MTQLGFYWYEPTGVEASHIVWGQLAGAMHRLRYAADELEGVLEVTDPVTLVRRLAYHAENYLIRVYELRERALSLVASACRDHGIARELRHRDTREGALRQVCNLIPDLGAPLAELLNEMDHDVDLRNVHTHETFLQLGLVRHGEVYDPEDALTDLAGRPEDRQRLEEILRREASRLSEEYSGKAERVIGFTNTILRVCEPSETPRARPRNPPGSTRG